MHIWRKLATRGWLDHHEEALREYAGSGLAVIEQPRRPKLQVECCCTSRRKAQSLERQFGGATAPLPRNWQHAFFSASRRKPLRIGRRLIIFQDETERQQDSGRSGTALVVPSGLAFGTGDHFTTAMCLRLLEEHSRRLPPNWSMLDIGTGTGVLALAAAAFGASRVVAIDNDPQAITTAKQNARLNGVSTVRFQRADALLWRDNARYDIITANLFCDLLVRALPIFRKQLRAVGLLIISGVLGSQEHEIVRALRSAQMRVQVRRRRGKWIALVAG